ncbi:hypothetical protein BDZ97DRAFT_2062066 [Flammula alnicola]|nr:hypothetical protein BDZ97DRAFT_2062066 [Flammula alnicola]
MKASRNFSSTDSASRVKRSRLLSNQHPVRHRCMCNLVVMSRNCRHRYSTKPCCRHKIPKVPDVQHPPELATSTAKGSVFPLEEVTDVGMGGDKGLGNGEIGSQKASQPFKLLLKNALAYSAHVTSGPAASRLDALKLNDTSHLQLQNPQKAKWLQCHQAQACHPLVKVSSPHLRHPCFHRMLPFSTNSFAEWNLFGDKYCKTNKRATKQEVKDAFEALSDSEKQKWSALHKEKLAQKKEARNAVAMGQ